MVVDWIRLEIKNQSRKSEGHVNRVHNKENQKHKKTNHGM